MMMAGYDWEYLIEERNCELAASFKVFTYRFPFFISNFSYYFYIGISFLEVLIWYNICSTVDP
jgi:hypothetical protein